MGAINVQSGFLGKKIQSKDNYIMREIARQSIIVPVGDRIADFSGIITANDSAAFLWKCLKEMTSQEELEQRMREQYGFSEELAHQDVGDFLTLLLEHGMLAVL